ncbi:hypothetical protein IR196_04775 [Brucella anthropi]|uniref:hypothetical protein n=1 Tax=Brucella anthropi TaxID=529 RepID=UPI00188ADCC9|nr:hypothetical protein [Brucella anthropi]QPA27183.1 hypothetical protein IR196_04775 [Brucella anthropi]
MANWNEIRFHDNLKRERDRLADCPHITNTENETFRAVIDEILQAVMSSHPRPMGRESRPSPTFIQGLRDVVREHQRQREAEGNQIYTCIPLDHLTEEEAARDYGNNVKVIEFSKNIKDKTDC